MKEYNVLKTEEYLEAVEDIVEHHCGEGCPFFDKENCENGSCFFQCAQIRTEDQGECYDEAGRAIAKFNLHKDGHCGIPMPTSVPPMPKCAPPKGSTGDNQCKRYDCTKVSDFVHEKKRLCKSTMCDECPLNSVSCDYIELVNEEDIAKLQKWSDEHPEGSSDLDDYADAMHRYCQTYGKHPGHVIELVAFQEQEIKKLRTNIQWLKSQKITIEKREK